MGRGPSYPYVNLSEAVELTRKVYNFTRKSPAPLESVVREAWEYSPTSSSGEKVLAALKAFGLVEETVSGEAKMLKISDRAYRILVDDAESAERLKALRDAALSPKWYKFCWETWGKEMPPSMRSNLLFEHHFVESTVDKFIEDYKASIQFGRIVEGAKEAVSKNKSKEEENGSVQIGDAVQWESQGVVQFADPKRVREISDDGQWAFVEGSNVGLPVKELTVVTQPIPPTPRKRVEDTPLVITSPGFRKELFSLPEGDITVAWPASIGADSLKDIEDWFPILQRKIKKSVAGKKATETSDEA